jgi:hypothetical protein
MGAITEMPMADFKTWAKSGHLKEPLGTLPESAAGDPSDAQLAARAKAARRIGMASTSPKGEPIPAHSFIAAEGGLSRETMADMGFDRNVRIGNRTLFAGKGKGMSIEQATQNLIDSGYLTADDHNAARDLIKRSLTHPQYTPEGTERMAQAATDTRFEDHLTAQQENESDPFAPLTPEELADTGYDRLSREDQAKFEALVAAAEAEGIDTEAIIDKAAKLTHNGTQHDFTQAAATELESARTRSQSVAAREDSQQGRPAAEPAGDAGRQPVPGKQSPQSSSEKVDTKTPSSEGVVISATPKVTAREAAAASEARRAEEKKAERKATAAAKAPQSLSIGMTPANAEPVSVKDGVIHIGDSEAMDFENGDPVKVKEGATDREIVQALRDAGALSRRQKVFGLAAEESTDQAQESPPSEETDGKATEDAIKLPPSQTQAEPPTARPEALIELRKRDSVLEALRKCMGA